MTYCVIHNHFYTLYAFIIIGRTNYILTLITDTLTHHAPQVTPHLRALSSRSGGLDDQ